MKQKSSMLWQKMLALSLALFLIIPSVIIAQAGRANFSGNWALNESKSANAGGGGGQGGQRMGMTSATMTVTQEANKLSVARTMPNRGGGTMSITTEYSLDGKETVDSSRGESRSVAVWSSDGKSLTITTTRNFNGNSMKTVEVWSVDGSALTIKSTASTPNGDRTSTLVYDKK